MYRVAHCIDNGPWKTSRASLKRERYYDRRFTSKQEFVQIFVSFIYNTRRTQRNRRGCLISMKKLLLFLAERQQCTSCCPENLYFLLLA